MCRPIAKVRFGRAIVEDFLDAAGLDEIRRPLNGILGSEGRSPGRIVGNSYLEIISGVARNRALVSQQFQ